MPELKSFHNLIVLSPKQILNLSMASQKTEVLILKKMNERQKGILYHFFNSLVDNSALYYLFYRVLVES